MSFSLETRIVDAAIEYMSAFGSEKLNVRDVARHARVGRATIYKYFGTKQGLLEATELRLRELMVEVLTEAAASVEGLTNQAAASRPAYADHARTGRRRRGSGSSAPSKKVRFSLRTRANTCGACATCFGRSS